MARFFQCSVFGVHSFLWLNGTTLYRYTAVCLCIQRVVDIWVAFCYLVMMNKAAVNICLYALCRGGKLQFSLYFTKDQDVKVKNH